MQEVGDAVLGAAGEELERAIPLLPFGAITTKPDFAELGKREGLVVEFKCPASRKRLREIHKEMAQRLLAY